MAHLSDDAGLLNAFAEDRGHPPRHRRRGVRRRRWTSQRRPAAHGQGHQLRPDLRHVGVRPGQPAQPRARRRAGLHRPLLRALSRRRRLHGATREAAREQGYVETVFGRRLWLPEINAKNPQRRQGAERAAINAPMQGTAADLIKLAMIAVQGWLDRKNWQAACCCRCTTNWCSKCPNANSTAYAPNCRRTCAMSPHSRCRCAWASARAELGSGALIPARPAP